MDMVNRKVKIVVACGAAIAQSSMLQMMISSYLDEWSRSKSGTEQRR